MRYKARSGLLALALGGAKELCLFCVFILLIATPAQSQEFSPIVIETGKPTPSVVKSGEPFKVTYRAKFFDTVVIYEEQMQPANLALDKIEVISLGVAKKRVSNDTLGFVNIWDFTYTFRIIQPERGLYKIPPFNFVWVEKKAGVTAEEAKDKEKPGEMPTEEVGIGYVSSVKPADKPVKPPLLDIRDEISFVSPIADGAVWRRWAYGVIGATFLWTVIIVFKFARYSKTRQSQEAGREVGAETAEDDLIINIEPILPPKQARKEFLKELNKLQGGNTLDWTKKIHYLVRKLLLAELNGTIRDSMSANEIYSKLGGLDLGQRKRLPPHYEVFMNLAQRLKIYQEDIDSGTCSLNTVGEITELREAVSGLKFHKRVSSFVKRLAGKRR